MSGGGRSRVRERAGALRSRRRTSTWAVLVGAAAVVAGCTSGDDGSDATVSSAPVIESTTTAAVFTSEPDGAGSDGAEPVASDFIEAPVVTDAVVLDDDVIIATDDGEIPTTTTEPPVDPGPDSVPTAPTTTAAPVEVPDATEIQRIVSLSPTHTETLFALGLGELVVAVDAESDFPPAAASLQRDDISAGRADLTSLLALDPDVVVLGEDPTGMAGRLAAADIPTFSGPPADTLVDVFDQIAAVAQLVERPDLADDLIEQMRGEIDAIRSALPAGDDRTFFHEVDPSLFTIAGPSLLASLYGELGLSNIVTGSEPFVQVTNELVLAADPDVILLADAQCCDVTLDRIAARPGWAELSAVTDGAVVELDDDIASRWGPRVVELLRAVAGGVIAAA